MTNDWFKLMGFGADRPTEAAHPLQEDWEKAAWILTQLVHYNPGDIRTSGSHARDRETIARALAADRVLRQRGA